MPGTCGPALLLLLLVLLAAAPAPADAFSDYSEEAELSVKIARITPRFPLAGGTFTASFDVTSEFDRSPVLETQVEGRSTGSQRAVRVCQAARPHACASACRRVHMHGSRRGRRGRGRMRRP
jgi:hypothetical protein